MLQKTKRSDPPEVMTWPKATPVLAIAVVFDPLRFLFTWFVFFGPALAALYCTLKVSDSIGTTAAGFVCTAGAGIVGIFGAEITTPLGAVMAMVTALAGWMAIGVYLIRKNPRIFRENALWFGGSLLLSEVPFVNSIPAFTITMLKMYSTQIRVEKIAYKKWSEKNSAIDRQERDRQALQQSQSLQLQQADQQQALDNEWQGHLAQQDERETAGDDFGGMQFNQQGAENEKDNNNDARA